jgi:cytochrome c oxidase assembly protein subunit 15
MDQRLEHLRRRAQRFTLTPAQYARTAYVAMGALTVIVMSGAAVRLTGSGLGCPTWPRCYGKIYPPLQTHAVIEFSNRMITVPVSIAALVAFGFAFRRRPYRRDLMWLSALLPLGVLAQAVLGGLTVRGQLDYGWVMAHFALSMLVLAAAVALAWRATFDPYAHPPERPLARDRTLALCARATVALGALTIFVGTAATAAGPHAGGSPGQKINRLDFDGRGTMDFVIHRHAEIAFVFGLAALGVWWLAHRRAAEEIVRLYATITCGLIAMQGAVGLVQYETHLPSELVWIHVSLAALTWLSVLWTACAAGRLQPRAANVPRKLGPEMGEDRASERADVLATR